MKTPTRSELIDRCASALRALREVNPERAEPFARALAACVMMRALPATLRDLSAEIDAAYRAEVAR